MRLAALRSSVRNGGDTAFAFGGPPPGARHVRAGSGLIQEDQRGGSVGRTHRCRSEIVRKCPRSVRKHKRRPKTGRREHGNRRRTTTSKEPQVGIEPTTARLRIECSTTELLWRNYRRRKADGGRQCLPSAVYRLPSDNTCPGSDSNRDALRHHPLKMACLPVSPPGQSQRVHLRALQQRSNSGPPTTGATGFEPATSRVTVECSNQTELRPLHLCTLLPRAFAE